MLQEKVAKPAAMGMRAAFLKNKPQQPRKENVCADSMGAKALNTAAKIGTEPQVRASGHSWHTLGPSVGDHPLLTLL